MSARRRDLYGGKDPRTLPAYTIAEAAAYLRIPRSTVGSWVKGRRYTTMSGHQKFSRVVAPARDAPCLLSFENLVELHVLRATRDKGVSIGAIRSAVWYLQAKWDSEHPLAREDMQTDGVSIFVDHLGALVNVSQNGQVAIRMALEQHLNRIDRGPKGLPIRLYPFGGRNETSRPFTIDPAIKFGRLCLAGTGITVEELVSRHHAGESIPSLARDFDRPEKQIREALKDAA